MVKKFEFWHHHGGISVPDLDAAIAWWRDVLGFEVERRFPIPAIPAQVVILKNGPLHIELFQVEGAKPLPEERRQPDTDVYTHGNKHVSFAVESVHEFAEQLKARGADIVWVKEMEQGANIFIRDNAGNLVEFVEAPKPTHGYAELSAGYKLRLEG
jgi:methylmalonyl-CoA/ethylmalonyl-CoA epimerase